MSKELIKDYLDNQEVKPKKQAVTVYMTNSVLAKLDIVVDEFKSTRTGIVSAMINIYTKGED
jgi:hypothetical protein